MDGNLEIRKVPPRAMYELIQILECGNDWKKLMSIVPKNNERQYSKYNYEHVKRVEDAGNVERRPCAQIFLEEWSTTGRKQPTLRELKHLLLKAQLFRAAEYVAIHLLGESAPSRPETGPAAAVDLSEETIKMLVDVGSKFKRFRDNSTSKEDENTSLHHSCNGYSPVNVSPIYNKQDSVLKLMDNNMHDEQGSAGRCDNDNSSSGSSEKSSLGHIPYAELERYTYSFCDEPFVGNENAGRKLGTGAFGSVYLGILPSSLKIAVKRLKNDAVNVEKQFKNEVETLSRYQHRNLLSLLKYSFDGPHYCLVYAFMCNGSLQDRLALKVLLCFACACIRQECGDVPLCGFTNTARSCLPWEKRLEIALGTARGILYLHTAYETPLIHRDVKSANVLLDEDLTPKLGDFGLVRLGASGVQSIAVTTTVFGTSAYMAPEAFRGDISVKLDSFSFGVVLLELLTSLPPYDETREGCDLVTHVEDICEKSIEPLLDLQAGSWGITPSQNPSEVLYLIAKNCLKERRQRPEMNAVVEELHKLICSVHE